MNMIEFEIDIAKSNIQMERIIQAETPKRPMSETKRKLVLDRSAYRLKIALKKLERYKQDHPEYFV